MEYAAYKDADGHAYINPLRHSEQEAGNCINDAECLYIGSIDAAQAAADAINKNLPELRFEDLLK